MVNAFKPSPDTNLHPIDATKVWPEDMFPLMKVGKLVLTDPPSDFFEESEQVAYSPANFVPGVEPSNCKLLQGRLFSYNDTQRHRLGPNFAKLPINMPKVTVINNQRDGNMDYERNKGKVNYNPNILNDGEPKVAEVEYKECPVYIEGNIEKEVISKTNDFEQAGDQYRSYSKEEKDHLIDNIVNDLFTVDKEIQLKAIENFTKSCDEYGERIRKGLNL